MEATASGSKLGLEADTDLVLRNPEEGFVHNLVALQLKVEMRNL